MAHFAKLGANGKVIQVLTLDNKDMLNADGVEDEAVGQQYLELHNNWPAQMWIQTSYNTSSNQHKLGGTPFRGNYAGIGYTWNEDDQIFWPKKPYASWVNILQLHLGNLQSVMHQHYLQNKLHKIKLIPIYGLMNGMKKDNLGI